MSPGVRFGEALGAVHLDGLRGRGVDGMPEPERIASGYDPTGSRSREQQRPRVGALNAYSPPDTLTHTNYIIEIKPPNILKINQHRSEFCQAPITQLTFGSYA